MDATYGYFGGEKVMAISTSSAKELVGLDHVERVEDRGTEFDMTVMTWTVEGGESTGSAAGAIKIVR